MIAAVICKDCGRALGKFQLSGAECVVEVATCHCRVMDPDLLPGNMKRWLDHRVLRVPPIPTVK